jgi:hypothetical protein
MRRARGDHVGHARRSGLRRTRILLRPPVAGIVSSAADDVETSPSVTVVTATNTILPPRGAQAGSEKVTDVVAMCAGVALAPVAPTTAPIAGANARQILLP